MPDTLQELHLGVESMSLLQRGKRETRHTDVMFLTSGRADGVLWLGLPDNDETRRRVVTGARTRIPSEENSCSSTPSIVLSSEWREVQYRKMTGLLGEY